MENTEKQVVHQIHQIDLDTLNKMATYYANQCKSRTDSKLIKEMIKELARMYNIEADKDYAILPIKR